jgi:HSP20 family protein
MYREGSSLADKCGRWKKRSELDKFFKEFDRLDKMVDNVVNDSTKDSAEREERNFLNPYVLGFSVSISPDGKPQVYRFGSSRSPLQGAQAEKENEPLLDILDCKKEIIVIAELHGVDKKDIKLDVSESTLRISVDTTGGSFYKNLCLPAKVCADSMQTSYKNGVLEVRLKRASRKLLSIKKHLISGV